VIDWSSVSARAVQVSDGLSSALERMIRDGVIVHEERLPPERELAQQLGVSRTSLREALHELELKGLIDRRPGRGTLVLDPNLSRVGASLLGHMATDERGLRHVMDLRAAIEPPIAARAAQRATARDIARLHELLAAMRRERSRAAIGQLDVQFHDAIAASTHNPHLVRLLRFAAEWIDESRRALAFDRRRRERSIAAHTEILACIEARDAEGAAHAMERHIQAVHDLLAEAEAS
jgi:GntR family transcriptional regulator, transcriptional repressor for pyruvate dehydrogenase complex